VPFPILKKGAAPLLVERFPQMKTYAVSVNKIALKHKIAKDDPFWKEFNGTYENKWLGEEELAENICTGHAYTAWHDPQYRNSQNWKLSQCIPIDLDDGTYKSSMAGVKEQDFTRAFASIIHTTPSHTPEFPRTRCIFLLDEPITDPNKYRSACRFLAKLMGGDMAATDPSRQFYGNDHAEIALLHGRLEVGYLRYLYQREQLHQQEVANSHNRNNSQYGTTHAQGQAQHTGRSEDVSKLLDRIDPLGIEYHDWVASIAAIKHELGDSGLPIAIGWAQGKKGEVERMWRSMRRESGVVATFGKLCHLAYPSR